MRTVLADSPPSHWNAEAPKPFTEERLCAYLEGNLEERTFLVLPRPRTPED